MNEEILIQEIKTLKKASEIHAKYSITQYKKVLQLIEDLEKEIEENKELNKKLKELATFDPLTKLLNRRAFMQKLQELKDEYFSIMFLDLDGFKQVNDIYGHKIGDELLKIVSRKIINSLREDDIVARFGGDEFVILIKGKKTKKDLSIIANKLIDKISSPIKIDKITAKVGVSIGIYSYDKNNDNIDEILSFSDSAMYKAKKSGKGVYVFFNKNLHKTYIQQKLIQALKENNIKKIFIPIFHNKELFARELLLELDNFKFDDILNAIEEEKHLLEKLTLFMIKNNNQKTLIKLHYKLINQEFLEKIKDTTNICFSIDSSHLKYIKKENLKLFREYGFKIVLDKFEKIEFGLSYLKLPIDAIRIFKNSEDETDKKICHTIFELAKELNIKVIIKCDNHSFCIV